MDCCLQFAPSKKNSLADQCATNKEHIEKWNGILIEELSVPGKSRSIVTWEEACARIDAYARLKELIEGRAFDVLIYRDNSRLGRTTSLVVTIAELCFRAGIQMYSTDSPPTELAKPVRNLAARMVDVFQSVMAQEEVDKFRRRNEMGMKARVMRGEFPGKIPYGWKEVHQVQGEKIITGVEIDAVPAAAIRMIVDLYLRKGMGMRPIARQLSAHGYKRAGGSASWTIDAVSQTLDLVWRYAGYVEINAKEDSSREYIRAKSRWPTIISDEDARAVEREREYRAEGKRRVGSPNRFSGVVWCAQCQKRMTASFEWQPNSKAPNRRRVKERFICRDMVKLQRHLKGQISANYIMASVRDAFEFLSDKANQDKMLGALVNKADQIRASIAATEKAISGQDAALARADDAYIDGKMTVERYNNQVERIKSQWQALQADLEELKYQLDQELFHNRRGERLQEIAEQGIKMLDTEDIATANAWLRRHVEIWVDNDNEEERIRVVPL